MEDNKRMIVFLYLSKHCPACNAFKAQGGIEKLESICDSLSLDLSIHNDVMPPSCVLNNVKPERIAFPFLYIYTSGYVILVPPSIVFREGNSAVNYFSMALVSLTDASRKTPKTPNSSSVSPRRMKR